MTRGGLHPNLIGGSMRNTQPLGGWISVCEAAGMAQQRKQSGSAPQCVCDSLNRRGGGDRLVVRRVLRVASWVGPFAGYRAV